MESTASFGYWLRRRRKALDLTQAALANQAGCALGTLKKIETDERRPSHQLTERLADCLAIPATERTAFVRAARAELATDQLGVSAQPLAPKDADTAQLGETVHPNNTERLSVEQALNHKTGIAGAHGALGMIALVGGDLDEAAEYLTESLEQYREVGHTSSIASYSSGSRDHRRTAGQRGARRGVLSGKSRALARVESHLQRDRYPLSAG